MSLVAFEEKLSLSLAQQYWRQAGCPTERSELAALLEKILLKCQQDGIPYPRILLLRKRQLEGRQLPGRPSWEPRSESEETAGLPSTAAARTPEGARQMIADLKNPKHPGTPEEIEWWEQELKRRESAAANAQPSDQPARLGPQLVRKEKTA